MTLVLLFFCCTLCYLR